MKYTMEHRLEIMRRAWRNQPGWVFLPWMKGGCKDKRERLQTFREESFRWPEDREKILSHMQAHVGDDLFWSPAVYEGRARLTELAWDETCLWADLDQVDPREIEDGLRPTVAWETSPNRYQALWYLDGKYLGFSGIGDLNHRLTDYLGADPSGWDTTQLLRVPEWANHKPERVEENGGIPPIGKLLWRGERVYAPSDIEWIPHLPDRATFEGVMLDQLEAVDRFEVWARVKLKVSSRVRELIGAKIADGDRSERLWEIERELADAGCTVSEIVALVQPTVWNKYADRASELQQLINEATKAIAQRTPESTEAIQEERDTRPDAILLADVLRSIKKPRWLVKNIITQGACGFIAGQPKSFKSWMALDLAISVAEGLPFLGHYRVDAPGPVFYIQEEDGPPLIKQRIEKIWPEKIKDCGVIEGMVDGKLVLDPHGGIDNLQVYASVNLGLVLSEVEWQEWLDYQLSRHEFRLCIIDPLLMVMGDKVTESASDIMAKVLRPIKVLAKKYNVAMMLVHHLKKGETSGQRGGQMMLGSVAYHAWAEDSMYVSPITKDGFLHVERESKLAWAENFKVTNVRNDIWNPKVIDNIAEELEYKDTNKVRSDGSTVTGGGGESKWDQTNISKQRKQRQRVKLTFTTLKAQHDRESFTSKELQKFWKLASHYGVKQQLTRAVEKGWLEVDDTGEDTLWKLRDDT